MSNTLTVYDREWSRFRRCYLSRPENQFCRSCGHSAWSCKDKRGRYLPAEVDHIIPLERGGAKYDENNLQVLCHDCHSQKSMLERYGRSLVLKGCNADGTPRDPDHHWYEK